MATPRRDFLGWLGAGGVLAATGIPLRSPEGRPAAERAVRNDWDMTWVDRLQGKYRAVFDSPEIAEGSAVFRAVMWRNQHQEVYGTAPADLGAVLVIRHEAIALAMSDAYWDRFEVGKEAKLKDPATKEWARVNPVRTTRPDTPPKWAAYNLESFMASGGIVLACNMAFDDVVSNYRTKDKLTREDAVVRAKEQLIPGIILQPSGIFAALRAQEAGCNYIMAS